MDIVRRFFDAKEFAAAGLFEQPHRSLFYRKSLGIRRYFENYPLQPYEGKPLYPSGPIDRSCAICWDFMAGFSVYAPNSGKLEAELLDAFQKDFGRYHSFVPKEHTVTGNMSAHSIPHYERIAQEGFASYIPRIEKIEDTDMREGLMHIMAGIRCWLDRILAYLHSVDADEKLIAALERVPMEPARDIYEAVVCWNIVMYLDGCDNLGCVADGLMPWYKGENIVPLLENLFDNLDVNEGYSLALHTNYDPLTLQCLEAVKGKRRPMIQLFVDENTPTEVWQKAFESLRTSNGQPAFYNPKGMLGGLAQKVPELTEADLRKFCGSGCTESQIAGLSNVGTVDSGINLLYILEKSMYKHLPTAKSFEDFYGKFIADVRRDVQTVTDAISRSQLARAEFSPLPMRTLLVDDCIGKGLDYYNGGARFAWSLISFAGLINVIDSLLVIRDFLFMQKRYTVADFLHLLKNSDEDFLYACRHHNVCFGIDNLDANAMANRVSTDIYSMLDGHKPHFGSAFFPCSILFRSAAIKGKEVGATPDGRSSGAPLADSLGAIFGKDIKGPTALLKSVTSLNLERALGTPVLNFCIDPTIQDSNLKALILGYMQLGGMQMQITFADAKTLQEAYDNPDMHRNLIVRVGGYSDYFWKLSDELKRMIISRTIHK